MFICSLVLKNIAALMYIAFQINFKVVKKILNLEKTSCLPMQAARERKDH